MEEFWGRRSYGNALRITLLPEENVLEGETAVVLFWCERAASDASSDDADLARSFGAMDTSVFVLRRMAGPGGS